MAGGLVVKDMGLLVARGVGGIQGLWLSSVAELASVIRFMSDAADADTFVSAVLNAANDAVLVPIVAGINVQVKTAWWFNGGVVAGNVDAGLYDLDFNLLASTGAVAQSGTSVPQSAALLQAYDLLAGQPYYLALSSSSATAQFSALDAAGAARARATGCARATSSHPLPASVTPVQMAQRQIPIFGLTYRTAGI